MKSVNDDDLAGRKCSVCVPGTPTLSAERARELHREVSSEWRLDEDRITRTFKFKDFGEPFALATRVALLAEEEGHHPDLEISWGKLTVRFKTHVAGGLTENDFIMAAKVDKAAGG